jgi:hypothetical protein
MIEKEVNAMLFPEGDVSVLVFANSETVFVV